MDGLATSFDHTVLGSLGDKFLLGPKDMTTLPARTAVAFKIFFVLVMDVAERSVIA